MLSLTFITLILVVYGELHYSHAVVINMNDFVDGLFADLENNALDLGLSPMKLPEASLDINVALVSGEVSLTNGKTEDLNFMSRTNDISVEVTGNSAEATGNNIAFKSPLKIDYDIKVSLLTLNVNGSIDITINGLTSKMWGIVSLNDSETFSVEMEGCTLNPLSIDVNVDGLGLADDVLEAVTAAVNEYVDTLLNDVIAVSITNIIEAYLKGRVYNIPLTEKI